MGVPPFFLMFSARLPDVMSSCDCLYMTTVRASLTVMPSDVSLENWHFSVRVINLKLYLDGGDYWAPKYSGDLNTEHLNRELI